MYSHKWLCIICMHNFMTLSFHKTKTLLLANLRKRSLTCIFFRYWFNSLIQIMLLFVVTLFTKIKNLPLQFCLIKTAFVSFFYIDCILPHTSSLQLERSRLVPQVCYLRSEICSFIANSWSDAAYLFSW